MFSIIIPIFNEAQNLVKLINEINKSLSDFNTYEIILVNDASNDDTINIVNNYFFNKKKNIKSFLIDQKFVSGIGNIYASEILFLSKISPKKNVNKLSLKECKKIIFFSKDVLNKAIKKGGSSIRDFKNISGKSGNYQKEFKVYNRENLNCLRNKCNGKIKKIFISNRSTFFCNICQK